MVRVHTQVPKVAAMSRRIVVVVVLVIINRILRIDVRLKVEISLLRRLSPTM